MLLFEGGGDTDRLCCFQRGKIVTGDPECRAIDGIIRSFFYPQLCVLRGLSQLYV